MGVMMRRKKMKMMRMMTWRTRMMMMTLKMRLTKILRWKKNKVNNQRIQKARRAHRKLPRLRLARRRSE